MATITEPMALDKTFNTTETTPRSQADVLAAIENAIRQGFGQVASAVEYDNTDSGLTADNVQDAIDEVDDTVDGLVDDVTEISSDIESTKTATGNPLTLQNCAPINAESLVVELQPKQEGSGDPSPTNIRPITGYTQTSVEGCGKNLFDKSDVINGGFNADGTVYESAADSRRVGRYIAVEPSTEYYISNAVPLTAGRTGFWYDENKTSISQITFPSTVQTSGAVTSPNNAKYIRLCVPSSTLDTAQLEVGNQATVYEPFISTSATIEFGQTVYGAEVDFGGGTDDVFGDVYLGSLSWTRDSSVSHPYFYALAPSDIDGVTSATVLNGLCEIYKVMSANNVIVNGTDGGIGLTTSKYLAVSDSRYTDATEFTAMLQNENAKLVYEKATHTQLSTPRTPLKMLKGTNNLSADGNMELGYQPDNVIGEVKGEIEKCSPNPEFMHFEVNGDVVDAIPIIFDEAIHSYTVSGDNWKDKTFLCVECCDMRYGILQLVLSSDMAFVDSTKKALLLYPYMRSVEQYIKITISLSESYGYELSYQTTSTSSMLDYLKIRVRVFN